MLLLVTLVLVVVSAVLLVLGFVQDALGFIYLSMLCAGVAALALFVFARLARRRTAILVASGAVTPPGPKAAAGPPGAGSTGSARLGAVGDEQPPGREDLGAGGGALGTPQRDVDTPERPVGSEPDEDPEDWGDEVVFPIEGYDDLRVSDILPLLGQLDPEELQEVRNRELAGKGRTTVLDRIDDRLGRGSRAARPANRQQRAGDSNPTERRSTSSRRAGAPGASPDRGATPGKAASSKRAAASESATPPAPAGGAEQAPPDPGATPRAARRSRSATTSKTARKTAGGSPATGRSATGRRATGGEPEAAAPDDAGPGQP